jgi:hypothetical protein
LVVAAHCQAAAARGKQHGETHIVGMTDDVT